MESVLLYLFGAASFIPHGYCLLWRPDLVAMHAFGDAFTALAYFLIPAAIVYFLRKRRHDLRREHFGIATLFAAFIIACAVTHVANLLTLWWPFYGLQGLIKVATAIISLATAGLIWQLMPGLLALPSPADLERANEALRSEVNAKNDALAQLREAQASLEGKVAERTEQLTRLNQRFELALANSGITVFEQDSELRYVWIYNAPTELAETEIVGRNEVEVLPLPAATQAAAVKNEAMRSGRRQEAEVMVTMPSGAHWYDLRVEPLAQGLGQGVMCVAIDVTARKRAEEQLRLVMHEMVHRVKNVFAVVNSIMSQTARRAKSITEFTTDFSERVLALSRGHDQLVREQWQSASLGSIAEAVIAPLVGKESFTTRVSIDGPEVGLDSSQVQNFALAFHELTTNSLKHGALSATAGRVRLTWSVSPSIDGPELKLRWEETGGPPVAAPTQQGFGRLMVETLVPRGLGGKGVLEFARSGVLWTLTMPLKRVDIALYPQDRK
ncbi:sensor histidine kinase [Phreatobacter oligotrophus]|uniref:histidine kinase n=1 Tax=Phreatobacter oligotrophus TaxID=1122261 RepID=A0A2T4YZR9_9HYPH|nr:PAS domain-containing sensor histidine kinase [Phreatobacter oligotrophus]PTM52728.1 two-component sensor histidine kinase [Phreatobacter oligotrophus]